MILESRGTQLNLNYPQIMGIVNVTPDSFSDGGQYNTPYKALAHAMELIQAGATIIDIGGESTRPGAAQVSTTEELERVIPVIEMLAQRCDAWISVDTSNAIVITEAAKAGAHLINDIRALKAPGALEAAVSSNLPVCLMHMQGEPGTMQQAPQYNDIFNQVLDFFKERIAICQQSGIAKDKLILDPGFGFGKTLNHNYQLLSRLDEFLQLELPLLVGMSRKSMIGQLLGVGPEQRLSGSIACAVIAAIKGAKIIRVHDVKETVDAIRVVEATFSA